MKTGDKVYWTDPAGEKSGEYEIIENKKYGSFIISKGGEQNTAYEKDLKMVTESPSLKVELTVSQKLIEDVICQGVESACVYWMEINEPDLKQLKSRFPADSGLAYGEKIAAGIMQKGHLLRLHEANDNVDFANPDEVIGNLCESGIRNGLKLLSERCFDSFYNIISEQWDDDDADNLIQFSVFGEVIYG